MRGEGYRVQDGCHNCVACLYQGGYLDSTQDYWYCYVDDFEKKYAVTVHRAERCVEPAGKCDLWKSEDSACQECGEKWDGDSRPHGPNCSFWED